MPLIQSPQVSEFGESLFRRVGRFMQGHEADRKPDRKIVNQGRSLLGVAAVGAALFGSVFVNALDRSDTLKPQDDQPAPATVNAAAISADLPANPHELVVHLTAGLDGNSPWAMARKAVGDEVRVEPFVAELERQAAATQHDPRPGYQPGDFRAGDPYTLTVRK